MSFSPKIVWVRVKKVLWPYLPLLNLLRVGGICVGENVKIWDIRIHDPHKIVSTTLDEMDNFCSLHCFLSIILNKTCLLLLFVHMPVVLPFMTHTTLSLCTN